MSENHTYDYIIAGAGAAGLSLLWYLLNSKQLNKKKILLADRQMEWNSEKTWCFWDDSDIPDKTWIHKSWNRIKVSDGKKTFFSKNGTSYHCIESKTFRQKLLKKAKDAPNVTLIEADISEFEEFPDEVVMRTSAGEYRASLAFQSVFQKFKVHRYGPQVLQHFRGLLIETKKPTFNDGEITLMDFDALSGTDACTAFFYILPYTETTALVEYTMFSDEILPIAEYDRAVKRYLENQFRLQKADYTITDTEQGVIPMDDALLSGKLNSRTLSIGTYGGATKPTTGYTFTRIQKHMKMIVAALEAGSAPQAYPQSKFRFRLYDHLLLRILKRHPKEGPQIFRQLFRKNDIQAVLHFLDERSSLAQEMKIFASLPWLPFFKALAETRFGWRVP